MRGTSGVRASHGPKLRGLVGAALWFLCCATGANAQEPQTLPPAQRVLEHKLDNGWRFLIYPRHEAPTISFETFVPVGAVDDPPGMSGMANLVKNLMFKGSSRVGTRDWSEEQPALQEVDEAHAAWLAAQKDGTPEELATARAALDRSRTRTTSWVQAEEFSRILEDAGCGDTLNAFSDQDSTRFVVSLPANQLELWCWMESERFRDPVFREFFVERDALLEDWQARAASDPSGVIGEALRATAYGSHPLGRPSIGNAQEIERVDRFAAFEFFREHYGARQLVTAIAGDVDPDVLIPLLDKYFSSVPSGPDVPSHVPPIPKQTAQRRVRVPFESEPLLWIAWHVPPLAHPDSAAIEIAVRLLGYARSSRLEKRINRSAALVSSLAVNHAWEGNRLESLALVRCALNIGAPPATLEQAIYEEIERLAAQGPSREELAGVKRVATADFYRSLRRNEVLARGLAAAQGMTGHWRHYFEREQRLGSVQAKEVQRVLRKWFTVENCSVALLAPAIQPDATGAAAESEE